MNLYEFVNQNFGTPADGTYQVTWDKGGPIIERMDLGAGYMVSTPGAYEVSGREPVDLGGLWEWLDDRKRDLYQPANYLGVWMDPTSGVLYFDVSTQIDEIGVAEFFGRTWDQIAIWDNVAKVAITIKQEVDA